MNSSMDSLVRRYIKDRTYSAISAAIKAKHISTIRLLTNFAKTNQWTLTTQVYEIMSASRIIDAWLENAAASGCYNTARTVLVTLSILSKEHRQPLLKKLFALACKDGSADLVRAMLCRKLIPTETMQLIKDTPGFYNSVLVPAHGLRLATQYGHLGVFVAIMNGCPDTNADEVIIPAIQYGRIAITNHLLQHGVKITVKQVGKLQDDLKKLYNYRGPRSFENKHLVLTYYLAAKAGMVNCPAAIPESNYLVWLIEDVEDSAYWGGRARELLEI
ncbi:hypothetical protein CC86DRAFT_406607 [Ophiobolus disseminans]|uniref:Ankyrin n=1 Tax=Ophiobolus disseminans TaxID=1469910 RepID=A0A6A6ZZ40_9PLEO|nr:hypothetical protein CC86DRAFT_406607 [Ophiobolus disseminans]